MMFAQAPDFAQPSTVLQYGYGGVLLFVMAWGIPWLVRRFEDSSARNQAHVEKITAAFVADQKEARLSTTGEFKGMRTCIEESHDALAEKLDAVYHLRKADHEQAERLRESKAEREREQHRKEGQK